MTQAEDYALAGEIAQRIYSAEVNFTIRAFFDAGFEWEIWSEKAGDPGLDGVADTHLLAMCHMADAAAARYPDSELARWWKGRQ